MFTQTLTLFCSLTVFSPRLSPPSISRPAPMAVIQDLPPEIFYHILELGSEPPKNLSTRTILDFRRLSLVARDWWEPSQRLLQLTAPRLTEQWQQHIASDTGGTSILRTVRVATLVHGLANPNRAVELLQFLRAERIRVSALDLTGIGSIPADLVDPELLLGGSFEESA